MANKESKRASGQKEKKPDEPVSAARITRRPAKKKKAKPQSSQRLSQVSVWRTDRRTQKPSLLYYTLVFLYKNLYILGITLLRMELRYRRRGRLYIRKMKARSAARRERMKIRGRYLWIRLIRRFTDPIDGVGDAYKAMKREARARRAKKKSAIPAYIGFVGAIFRFIWMVLRTLFNHLAPAAAIAFLVITINNVTSRPMGLSVEYKGEIIGYVRNEQDFVAVEKQVSNRVIDSDSFKLSYELPKFTLQEVTDDKITPTLTMVDRVIMASGKDIEQACGLYIDNVFRGAVTDKNSLLTKLYQTKRQHSTGRKNERLEFEKKISVREGLYPTSSIVPMEQLENLLDSYEAHQQVYEVQLGDTPTGIASKTGVPYSLLQEMNPGLGDSDIRVGDEILIAVARPNMSVKSIFTAVYEEEFDYPVDEIKSSTYAVGYREIAREGVNGLAEVTAEITTVNGLEVSRQVLDTVVLREAVDERVIVGTNVPTVTSRPSSGSTNQAGSTNVPSSSGFIWPTTGGYVNVGLNGYYGHTGVDIPGRSGQPIYASAAGTVTAVKYQNYAYGYHVYVDHGNGFVTLYAHNSAIYVEVGDYVNQGDVIAGMGRTGNASGNHCHFEVRYNNKIMNPVNYIGTRG